MAGEALRDMKYVKNIIVSATAFAWVLPGVGLGSARAQQPAEQPPAGEQPVAPTAMTTPTMTGPLAANPNPTTFDAGTARAGLSDRRDHPSRIAAE